MTKLSVCTHGTYAVPGRALAVVFALFALAVTGLIFLWTCPDSACFEDLLGKHRMFYRQLAWMGIGVVAFCLATRAKWKSWLKSAPFVAVGWLAIYAVASFQAKEHPCLSLRFGPFVLNAMALFPFAAALFLSWIVEKFRLSARTVLLIALAALSVHGAGVAFASPERRARFAALGRGENPHPTVSAQARSWAQKQYDGAFREAHWFCGNENYMRNNPIPGRFSDGMPVSAALIFGKWFNALVLALFGSLAFALVWCWRKSNCEAEKAYVAVAGLGALVPAAVGYGGCTGILPMLFVGVPLVSYGGTCLLVAGLACGVYVSSFRVGSTS